MISNLLHNLKFSITSMLRLTFTHCPGYSISNFALNSYDSGCDCTTIIISYTVQSPMFFCVCTLTLLHVGALIELN